MTNDTCGHPTADGDPCQNPATEGDHCWLDAHGGHADPSGRPSKLTDERVETITSTIAEGKSVASAARMANINRTTVYNWIERGEVEDEGPFAEFFNAIERALGHSEDFYFTTAMDLAIENGDHRFIASLMKQRHQDSWGDTKTGVESDRTVINIPDSVAEKWQRQPNDLLKR